MLIKKMAATSAPYVGPIQNSVAIEKRVRGEKDQTVEMREVLVN